MRHALLALLLVLTTWTWSPAPQAPRCCTSASCPMHMHARDAALCTIAGCTHDNARASFAHRDVVTTTRPIALPETIAIAQAFHTSAIRLEHQSTRAPEHPPRFLDSVS